MILNISEVGRELKISQQGASKRLHKYEKNEELKQYLVYENGKLIGLEQEGIEILRNIGQHRRSFSRDRKLFEYEAENRELKIENEHLKYERDREREISERLTQENEKLKAEINEFVGGSFWKRLTYKSRV